MLRMSFGAVGFYVQLRFHLAMTYSTYTAMVFKKIFVKLNFMPLIRNTI